MCSGGGGHISAARSVKSHLEDEHTIIIKDALGEILAPIDPIRYMTFGRHAGQDIYNFLLRHNQKKLTNILYKIGNSVIQLSKKRIKNIFERYFKQEKPDLIISVIPIINNALLKAAQECSIAYILIPTDLDISTFITDLQITQSDQAIMGLPFNYPEIRAKMNPHFFHPEAVKVTGFPLGKEFFEEKNKDKIKKELGIAASQPVVLLMMGATGSPATITYIRALSQVKLPFHLIACTGRNKTLQKKIHAMKIPEHIDITVIDTSHEISDMMAVADLCITKSGSVSFAEILYMNVPILLDKTTTPLLWEQLNFTFLTNHKLGKVITNFNQVSDLVTHYLSNPSELGKIKNNIKKLNKKNFGSQIQNLVNKKLPIQHAAETQKSIYESGI